MRQVCGVNNRSGQRRRGWRSGVAVIGRMAILSSTLAGAVDAQSASAPALRLSPTLYFTDSSAEQSSRVTLHARVDPLVRAVAGADASSLVQQLRAADQTLVALQRHAAYLKARTLENTEDRAAKDAYAGVNADKSVLRTAMENRLRRATPNEIASLGPFAKLAHDMQSSV